MTMVSVKIISLAAVCLASFKGAHGAEAGYDSFSGSRVSCLDELNHYRVAAGFSSFTESDILTSQAKDEAPSAKEATAKLDSKFLEYACNSLQSKSAALSTVQATFAVHSQSGTNADCSAAVEYWKGAIADFDSLPPEYQESTTPYNSSKNVSFVALFNPKANAAVDCAYVTCQKTTTQEPTPETNGGGSGGPGGGPVPGVEQTTSSTSTTKPTTSNDPSLDTNGEDNDKRGDELLQEDRSLQDERQTSSSHGRRLSDASGNAGRTIVEQTNVLVCATTPAALKAGERPFT
ncbi:hypothetical protein Emed_002944 [Eimeria media]